ncbi:hypothetical protein BCV69DRAFT_283019 [Microstroma glucosiphilum]|uniref:Uncharacterized protein n=1 Tax=Pseudomicrostroma glucosiphilum TaxID=1684307 RepID=A0A316U6F9_9BASI|nr:hypothetical protein BCV69DRAFT_283019 [Pseudomicrostroma glucosiphilum]PWN20802.1 hypothetical protein BCV69DRAFT_283019 [Pseudomicrostroma glucosiphilum]
MIPRPSPLCLQVALAARTSLARPSSKPPCHSLLSGFRLGVPGSSKRPTSLATAPLAGYHTKSNGPLSPRGMLSRTLPPPRLPALSFAMGRFASSSTKGPPTEPPLDPSKQPATRAPLTAAELSRLQSQAQQAHYSQRNRSLAYYSLATIIFAVGLTYAAVPLYRAFCSATGFGGAPKVGMGKFEPSRLVPSSTTAERIRVTFNTDCSDELPWSFKPSQEEIFVIPGETALAFFTAKSRSKKDIIGIATYNVAPDRIAPYFSKVECFCFEEQRLLAGEEVDLPVFFFIDNDFLDDPNVRDVKDVVLSYTFFAARRNKKTGQMEPDTDLENYSVGIDLPGVK